MTTTREEALAAIGRGWKVFPLKVNSKRPATPHGFKDWTDDPESVETIWAAHPNLNLAITTGLVSGVVVVDIDYDADAGYDGYETLAEWEREHGELPETVTAVTGRGGMHYYYRTDRATPTYKNTVDHIDVRGDGGYAMMAGSVHPDTGRTVEWENHPDDYEVAWADENVYALIEHFRERKEKFEGGDDGGWELPQGDVLKGERDETLFKYACLMRTNKTPRDVATAVLHEYNERHCKPPMPKGTVDKKIASAWKYKPGKSIEADGDDGGEPRRELKTRGSRGKFLHNVVGRELIEEHGACLLDGETPAIRTPDGSYKMGWDGFDSAIIDLDDECKINERREVKAYVKAKAPAMEQSPATLMGFKNGVLDVATMEFRPYRDGDVIPNVIPHDWDVHASSSLLLDTLEKIACGDLETQLNLTEFLGMCMMRSTLLMPYFPVLVGVGANGKSTYIHLINKVVGNENISALQPETISRHFMGVHIVGKTANLGDDIKGGYLNEDACSAIKSVATGDIMTTDVKGSVGFKFRPYCTMVFSCNAFPRLADTSEGFMRRLFPIEFNARFDKHAPGYDPAITEKLSEEPVLEAACVLGVEGLRRAMAQNGPTPNAMSESLKAEIVQEANTAMQWINDASVSLDDILDRTKEEVFQMYVEWCERNGYARTAMGSQSLSRMVCLYFRVACTRSSHREYSDRGRASVKVYERKVPKGAN